MADLVLRDMTRKEAEEELASFASDWQSARSRLLNLAERKAHKALGYPTFAEMVQDRLGISTSDRTIENHMAAARIERALSVPDSNAGATVAPGAVKLPLRAALEINKLPPDKWAQAYGEYASRDKHGNRTPGDLLTELKRIVKRILTVDDAPSTTPAIAPVMESRQKPDLTPIVPQVYEATETTPEQASATEAWLKKGLTDTREEEIGEEPAWAAPVVVEEPKPKPAEVAPTISDADCVGVIALSFVVTFDGIMRNGGSLEELHMDVIAFRRKYGV